MLDIFSFIESCKKVHFLKEYHGMLEGSLL